jgi:hypothetical protein
LGGAAGVGSAPWWPLSTIRGRTYTAGAAGASATAGVGVGAVPSWEAGAPGATSCVPVAPMCAAWPRLCRAARRRRASARPRATAMRFWHL